MNARLLERAGEDRHRDGERDEQDADQDHRALAPEAAGETRLGEPDAGEHDRPHREQAAGEVERHLRDRCGDEDRAQHAGSLSDLGCRSAALAAGPPS